MTWYYLVKQEIDEDFNSYNLNQKSSNLKNQNKSVINQQWNKIDFGRIEILGNVYILKPKLLFDQLQYAKEGNSNWNQFLLIIFALI